MTSVEDAIERCQLFMEAGVDMAKPMGVDTIAEIKRAMREIPGPAHGDAVAGGRAEGAQPRRAGRGRRGGGDVPVAAAVRGGQGGARRDAHAQGEESLLACNDQVLTLEEYYDLVGLKPMLAREEAYDKAAAALTQKRAAE